MQYKIIDFDEKYLGKEGVTILRLGEPNEYISHRVCQNILELVLWSDKLGFTLSSDKFNQNQLASLKMKIPIERIPFSIEAWETGKYDVVTRAGDKVEELLISKMLLSKNFTWVICAVVNNDLSTFTKDGKFNADYGCSHDLFLLEKA